VVEAHAVAQAEDPAQIARILPALREPRADLGAGVELGQRLVEVAQDGEGEELVATVRVERQGIAVERDPQRLLGSRLGAPAREWEANGGAAAEKSASTTT